MKRGRVILAIVSGAVVVGINVVPTLAVDPQPLIVAEPLTDRAAFADDVGLKIKIKVGGAETTVANVDGPSRTAVVRFTVQPGGRFPWHSHAGPVVVNVVSGSLTSQGADDCAERTYVEGQAFADPGFGHRHTAFNAGSSTTVLVATFFGAPASGSLLIPADPGC